MLDLHAVVELDLPCYYTRWQASQTFAVVLMNALRTCTLQLQFALKCVVAATNFNGHGMSTST